MILTGEMLETQTAAELGLRFAEDLVSPSGRIRPSMISRFFGAGVARGSWRFREEIDLAALDYSVDSLEAVDAHLERLHRSLPEGADGKNVDSLGTDQLRSIFPTVGCYVGEVLRRNGAAHNRWFYHHEMLQMKPERAGILGDAPSASTLLMLGTPNGDFVLPLGKVFKFLVDGPADATVGLARIVASGQERPDG